LVDRPPDRPPGRRLHQGLRARPRRRGRSATGAGHPTQRSGRRPTADSPAPQGDCPTGGRVEGCETSRSQLGLIVHLCGDEGPWAPDGPSGTVTHGVAPGGATQESGKILLTTSHTRHRSASESSRSL
jgi:hypothetical protein